MKTIYFKKTCAALIAMLLAASIMTGCKDTQDSGETEMSESSTSTSLLDIPVSEYNLESRPIEEGDDYAINKINNKSPEDSLPGGYKLMDYSEEDQGKFYLSDKSEIIIRAYNYNEDLLDMATWADSACAAIRVSNITKKAQDTNFEEPENVTVCGFDGIRYDTEIIQYQFSKTETDENGNALKEEVFRLRGRNYFFYSDQDAYAIMFDTRAENWDEQVALFEEFVKDLEVTKTEY